MDWELTDIKMRKQIADPEFYIGKGGVFTILESYSQEFATFPQKRKKKLKIIWPVGWLGSWSSWSVGTSGAGDIFESLSIMFLQNIFSLWFWAKLVCSCFKNFWRDRL